MDPKHSHQLESISSTLMGRTLREPSPPPHRKEQGSMLFVLMALVCALGITPSEGMCTNSVFLSSNPASCDVSTGCWSGKSCLCVPGFYCPSGCLYACQLGHTIPTMVAIVHLTASSALQGHIIRVQTVPLRALAYRVRSFVHRCYRFYPAPII